jgi:acylphosphatase
MIARFRATPSGNADPWRRVRPNGQIRTGIPLPQARLQNHCAATLRCGFVPSVTRLTGPAWARPRAQAGEGGQVLAMSRCRMTIYYSGRVQGVGFRYTAKLVAHGYEITGVVRNLPDGRVEIVAEGERDELEAYRKGMQDSEVGGLARHEEVQWTSGSGRFHGFEIIR